MRGYETAASRAECNSKKSGRWSRTTCSASTRPSYERLASDIALVNQVAQYIISSGGKRLRPLSVVLAARACGHRGEKHVAAAAIIEFIHTATLLHDDVVDGSDMRRGRNTANHVFGNEASVLVGDYLYSRAFQMMVDLGDMRIQDVMANATNMIAGRRSAAAHERARPRHDRGALPRGHLPQDRQAVRGRRADGRDHLARLAAEVEQAMVDFGRHLGTAFQLVDDALDYTAQRRGTGQEPGRRPGRGQADAAADLCAGALVAGRRGAPARAPSRSAASKTWRAITRAIESSGGLQYTARLARREKDLAIDALSRLPESEYRKALGALAEFAVARTY